MLLSKKLIKSVFVNLKAGKKDKRKLSFLRFNRLWITISVCVVTLGHARYLDQSSTNLPKLTCSVKCCKIPLKAGNAEHRTISAQDLSVNQPEAGFGNLFSSATPPVSKNRHSCSSILPLRKQRNKGTISNEYNWTVIVKTKYVFYKWRSMCHPRYLPLKIIEITKVWRNSKKNSIFLQKSKKTA